LSSHFQYDGNDVIYPVKCCHLVSEPLRSSVRQFLIYSTLCFHLILSLNDVSQFCCYFYCMFLQFGDEQGGATEVVTVQDMTNERMMSWRLAISALLKSGTAISMAGGLTGTSMYVSYADWSRFRRMMMKYATGNILPPMAENTYETVYFKRPRLEEVSLNTNPSTNNKSHAIARRTARCRCKFRYVLNFTTA